MVFDTRCNYLKLKTLGDSDSALKFKADGGQEEDTMPFAPTISRPHFFLWGVWRMGVGQYFQEVNILFLKNIFFIKSSNEVSLWLSY